MPASERAFLCLNGGKVPELDTMARTVYGEARGESDVGKAAVAWVIKNRAVKPGWWGKDIASVCLKRSQFSCWNADDPNASKCAAVDESNDALRHIKAICQAVLDGSIPDPTNGATHYHTKQVAPPWAATALPCAVIGNHLFYKGV